MRRRLLVPLLIAAALAVPARAQSPEERGRIRDAPLPAFVRPPATIADAVTKHQLDLPGRTLHLTATVGFVRLLDDKGAPEADVNTTAYTLDGVDPATRPVTFVLNGGPGESSAWLQMGAVGPWRVAMVPGTANPSAPQPNADTWLDFTDLVFVDPVGTGYSRFLNTSEETRKNIWSVNGDIASLSQAIRRWLDKSGRIGSPAYLLGESYGGFRGPRLARRLAERDGVGLHGLLLVSPLLDYGNHSGAFDVLGYAHLIPSMNASFRDAQGKPVARADLRDAEDYASGQFLADAIKGPADPAAFDRVVQRVAALTGLDPALVRQRGGLISSGEFVREHDRATAGIDSVYDATVALPDPFPGNPFSRAEDPLFFGLRPVLTQAMLSVYDRLRWHPDGPTYNLHSDDVGRQWQYGEGFARPQSMDALRQSLAIDPNLRVIVAHGVFDLVCPYFATQVLLNQIPPGAGADRVRLLTFAGGHMFYSRDGSREAFRTEAAKLLAGTP